MEDGTETRQDLIDRVTWAGTRQEIMDAKQAFRDWVQAHPEELGMLDLGEQIALSEEILEYKEERGIAHYDSDPARLLLRRQVRSARSPAEIEAVRQALQSWVDTHPDDEFIRPYFADLEEAELLLQFDAAPQPHPVTA